MAFYLAVANRKGGVGKSTISVMIAHAAAVWGGQRVLLLDLDSQCNASLILLGGQGWSEARKAGQTISDYFYDLFDGTNPKPRDYLIHGAGDVAGAADGRPANLSVLPGSLLLEDIQGELFMREAGNGAGDPEAVGLRVRSKLQRLMTRFGKEFDVVILDCAPGLSFAALAALHAADKVLVPFRPDYVSQLAVDRVALLIEEKRNLDDLEEIPFDKRRYTCLANYVRNIGPERVLVDEIADIHPMLETMLPQRDSIANAFDWVGQRRSMEQKYGDSIEDARKLYQEVAAMMPA